MLYGKKTKAGLKKVFLCLGIFILVGGFCAGCGESKPETITSQPEEEIRGNSVGSGGGSETGMQEVEQAEPEEEIRGNSVGNIANGGLVARQGDWIYYRNSSDGYKLYKVKTDGSGREKINDDSSWFINVVGDWIYYVNADDGYKLYKVKTDGSGRQVVE